MNSSYHIYITLQEKKDKFTRFFIKLNEKNHENN